jgi:hypothetical protein
LSPFVVCTDITPLPPILLLLLFPLIGDGIDDEVDEGVSILARFSGGGCKILNGFRSDELLLLLGDTDDEAEVEE